MAVAAAMASKMSAPTFGALSASTEIDGSDTDELAESVLVAFGTMPTLTVVGLAGASAGLARTTGGLVGLLSENSSEEGVGIEEVSGFEGSVD